VASNDKVKMKIRWLSLLFVLTIATSRADQAIANAQQVLKDQGFYYGEVTGEKNTDTSAAIRRFQIRNGLEITGELNPETDAALRKPAATPVPAATTAPPTAPAPVTPPAEPDLRDDNPTMQGPGPAGPQPMPPGAPGPNIYNGRPVPTGGGVFVRTPYDQAPPEIQRRVILDAQRILARQALFKGVVDGNFGPDTEFSLRAYQARVGLQTTGRLDLETLAALRLLPGMRGDRIYTPRRLPPGAEPPVRGEWIRP
jgi:peptidoglycan hydrolase-like protein with peptidoglycan-binding domain